MKRNFISCTGILLVVTSFTACNEEVPYNQYDTDYNANFVYIKPADDVYMDKEHTIVYSSADNIIVSPQSNAYLLSARSTKAAPRDMTVSFALDPTLVEAYNKEHGTDYAMLSNAKLEKETLTIKKGEFVTTDTLKVVYTDKKEFADGKNHLLPVVISKVSEGAQISEQSHVFIVYKSKQVQWLSTQEPIGKKVENRDAWTMQREGMEETSVLDGSFSWDYAWGEEEETVTVDMKAPVTVRSIAVSFYSDAGSYLRSKTMKVYVLEGDEYKDLGSQSFDLSGRTGTAYIDLLKPYTTAKFKITFEEFFVPYNPMVALTDIDVYTE